MPAITQEYSVWGALADGKGLTATYYNNSDATGSSVDIGAGEPVSVRAQGAGDTAPIDWSASAARSAPGAPSGDVASRVKLWLDNRLVIDQWSSLALDAPTR